METNYREMFMRYLTILFSLTMVIQSHLVVSNAFSQDKRSTEKTSTTRLTTDPNHAMSSLIQISKSDSETPKPKSYFIDLFFRYHNPPVEDWKMQFMAPTWLIMGGGQVGRTVINRFALSFGFTYGAYSHTHFNDRVTRFRLLIPYMNLEYSQPFDHKQNHILYLSTDLGYARIHGDVYLYSFRKIIFNRNQLMWTPRLGYRLHIGRKYAINLEVSYLFLSLKPIEIPVDWLNDLDIQFNGFAVSLGFRYQF